MNEQADAGKKFIKALSRAKQANSMGTAIKTAAITTGVALTLYLVLQRWRLRNE